MPKSLAKPLHVYPLAYRRLHWLLAMIIIMLLIAGQQFNLDLSESYRQHGLKAHSSLGLFSLFIALFFIFKRFIQRTPVPKANLSMIKMLSARVVQLSLYLLALIIPLTGILSALHSPTAVHLLGLYNISNFMQSDPSQFLWFREIHFWATGCAILLLACHVGAALYHHFIIKDNILKCMAVKDPLIVQLFGKLSAWLKTK